MPDALWLEADWTAPPGVRAVSTLRRGGTSSGCWQGLNLGSHVGDDPQAVACNRDLLRRTLALPGEPQWLRQVHGADVVEARGDGVERLADAAWTMRPGVACAVLTADCLPVVLAARDGSAVAVAHCGWRGLVAGVLATTVAAMPRDAPDLQAWFGPAIGPGAFEVGEDVRDAFLALPSSFGGEAGAAFEAREHRPGKYLADLFALGRAALRALGVRDISGGGRCTFSDAANFYSYRRDRETGRMATLVWIES